MVSDRAEGRAQLAVRVMRLRASSAHGIRVVLQHRRCVGIRVQLDDAAVLGTGDVRRTLAE